MGFFRKLAIILLFLSTTVTAAPVMLYDFETGLSTSLMDSSEIADGNWNGEVSESNYGIFYNGKMRFSEIAGLEFETSYTKYSFNWKNTSSMTSSNNKDPFNDLSAWKIKTEYNKGVANSYTFFTIIDGASLYEEEMGGLSATIASGLYQAYRLGTGLVFKIGGGLFFMRTPSDESYMPFEQKNGKHSYGLYPYFKIVWNENTTGKYRQGGSGYLEYGRGMVVKANLTTVHNQIYSMDYFFTSDRGEFSLDDNNPIADDGYIIKEEMAFGIRSNFQLQQHIKLSCEVSYTFERKWEILDTDSDSTRTLKPDACFGALVKLIYTF